MSGRAGHLQVVVNSNTGEVVDQPKCDGCKQRELEIAGLQAAIRSQAYKLRQAQLDQEADAYENKWYLPLADCFWYWREMTGHRQSQYTVDRFLVALPFANSRKYRLLIRAAIRGIAFDPFVAKKPNRNGRLERYDSWETLFKSADAFERYANRDPGRDWKPC